MGKVGTQWKMHWDSSISWKSVPVHVEHDGFVSCHQKNKEIILKMEINKYNKNNISVNIMICIWYNRVQIIKNQKYKYNFYE